MFETLFNTQSIMPVPGPTYVTTHASSQVVCQAPLKPPLMHRLRWCARPHLCHYSCIISGGVPGPANKAPQIGAAYAPFYVLSVLPLQQKDLNEKILNLGKIEFCRVHTSEILKISLGNF